jgi:hypothetical protein
MNTAIRRVVLGLLGDVPGAVTASPQGHPMLSEWVYDRTTVEYASLSSGEQAVLASAMSLHSGALYELFTRADAEHVEAFIGALIEVVRTTREGEDFIRTVKGGDL